MIWRTLTARDLRERKLNEVDPCDREVWRSNVRYAMRAASKLHVPGGGALMWMMLLHLHLPLNLNADDYDDIHLI